jgi:hypothetical protein
MRNLLNTSPAVNGQQSPDNLLHMKHYIPMSLIALGCLGTFSDALADCAGPNLDHKKRNYERAIAFEKQGNQEQALRAYHAAEGYACEDHNPYEADAAKRAAPLGLALGSAAEKKGNLRLAIELYEAGGQFSAADRALMALVRSSPDDPTVFTKARETLDERTLASFHSNNEAALNAVGGYRPDPKHMVEVLTMPAKGAERAFQQEASAFNEQYLRDYVQLIQARPDDPTDSTAMQNLMAKQQVFAQRWSHEPLKASGKALGLVRSWSIVTPDALLRAKLEAQRTQRIEQRVATLTRQYSSAPELLSSAMDYYIGAGFDQNVHDARLAQIRAQSLKLGDEASAQQRYLLASDYYKVARADAKAQAAQDKQQQIVMLKMQPSIDAAKRHAEQIQKEYSDPAKIQAMREQAEAMRKSLQQQQQANAKTKAKSADDLERELGL